MLVYNPIGLGDEGIVATRQTDTLVFTTSYSASSIPFTV